MISMDDYLELLETHKSIINHLMEQAKEEAVNEEFFSRKMAKALKKDMIKRTNEAIDVINGNFKLEKKGNYAVKVSDRYDKMPKSVYKSMTKLQRLQSKVDGYITYTGKGQTVEENNTTSEQQSNTDTPIEQTNTVEQQARTTQEAQAQQEIKPAKEPDAIEGQIELEELEGDTEQAETTEKAQTE